MLQKSKISLRGVLKTQERMSDVATALSLMRRLPPNKIEQNLSGMLNLLPEETDELLQRIDQPLQEAVCPDTVSCFFAKEESHLTCS